jgi:hypothetical protein
MVPVEARSGLFTNKEVATEARLPEPKTLPPSRPDFSASQSPETIGAFVVSGSEDFLVHVAVTTTRSTRSRSTSSPSDPKCPMSDVRCPMSDVRTSVVYEHVRQQVVLPARG